jgi:hypothetical protein
MADDYDEMDGEAKNEINKNLLYEMVNTVADELKEGSTLAARNDSFAYYFEKLFETPASEIDNIEEIIQQAYDSEEKIEIYNVIKRETANSFDKYFGITFDDLDLVPLSDIYTVYQVIYLDFISLLYDYAAGKAAENGLNEKELFEKAKEENIRSAADIADYIAGNYIMDENEFTSENIGSALDKADPGNEGYLYLFGCSPEGEFQEGETQRVYIDNNAFRLRVKKEYLNPAVKYLFELVYAGRLESKYN